jgi:hypothetical protein
LRTLPTPSGAIVSAESTNRDHAVGDKILSKSEALQLVSQMLETMTTPEESFVVVESETIEKPYGLVFFYNSTKFVETGIFSYPLAGNGSR